MSSHEHVIEHGARRPDNRTVRMQERIAALEVRGKKMPWRERNASNPVSCYGGRLLLREMWTRRTVEDVHDAMSTVHSVQCTDAVWEFC